MRSDITILVVEDEDPLRELYRNWLQARDVDVYTAADGEKAVEQWSDELDGVLLDRRLPEMYGDDVLEKVRGQGYHTPVAMVTAVNPDLDAIEMDFDEYMTKPITEDKLIETIEVLVELSDVRTTVRDFVKAGVTLHRLENEQPDEVLQTHAEYQQLKSQYDRLRKEVESISDDLTGYEKELLATAQQKIQ